MCLLTIALTLPPRRPAARYSPPPFARMLYPSFAPLRTPSSSSPPPQISLNTPPGTKVQLLGRIPVRQGYLQVGPNNVKVLGGSVLKLVEKWEANRLVEMTGRVYTGQVRDVMVDLRGQAALVG